MSGASVQYRIRVNKSVDRNLFMEFLSLFARYKSSPEISKYVYCGLGGYSFEDFKLMHLKLNISSMISIEENNGIFKRQKFNRPYSCIELKEMKSGNFIDCFSEFVNSPCIVWMDYEDANKRGQQLEEFARLIAKLSEWDVARITMNASTYTLDSACDDEKVLNTDETIIKLKQELVQLKLEDTPNKKKIHGLEERIKLRKRLHVIKQQIDLNYIPRIMPKEFDEEKMMTHDNFAKLLYYAITSAAKKQFLHTDKKFLPIFTLTYNDLKHKMLTITGVVLDRKTDQKEFFESSKIGGWELFSKDFEYWDKVKIHHIDVPDLTVKEKSIIDALLPLHPEKGAKDTDSLVKCISDQCGFEFDGKAIKNYLMYYRFYPNFRQVWF